MSQKQPKISICAISYNQINFIKICIESLLNQEVNFDYEIIIGDDCSTDGTADVVQGYKERYPEKIRVILNKKNIGARANFIATHSAAKGEYIAHVDCDDYFLPGKLQAQADVLDNEPECNIVWHRMRVLDDNSGQVRDDMISNPLIWNAKYTRSDLLRYGAIGCHSSKMYRAKYRFFELLPDPSPDFTYNIFNVDIGYSRYISDFYGVYRRSVGTETSAPNYSVYLNELSHFQEQYPEFTEQISENALLMFLVCIKNFDSNFWFAFRIFIKSKSLKPILRLIRDWQIRKCFRLD